MKGRTAIAASVAVLTITLLTVSSSAQARAHRHWHHYRHYTLYYDYSHDNWQSRWTYVYPAANWGPFFHRVRHYGQVLPYQPVTY